MVDRNPNWTEYRDSGRRQLLLSGLLQCQICNTRSTDPPWMLQLSAMTTRTCRGVFPSAVEMRRRLLMRVLKGRSRFVARCSHSRESGHSRYRSSLRQKTPTQSGCPGLASFDEVHTIVPLSIGPSTVVTPTMHLSIRQQGFISQNAWLF